VISWLPPRAIIEKVNEIADSPSDQAAPTSAWASAARSGGLPSALRTLTTPLPWGGRDGGKVRTSTTAIQAQKSGSVRKKAGR